MKTVDVGAVLDEGHWSGYQKLLIFATALTIILDGVDNQLLGVAIPSLTGEWGVPRSAFAAVLATGLVGMLVGGAIAGGFVGAALMTCPWTAASAAYCPGPGAVASNTWSSGGDTQQISPHISLSDHAIASVPVGVRGPARPGYTARMIAFFSSRLGCLGSLLVSLILTGLLYLLLTR